MAGNADQHETVMVISDHVDFATFIAGVKCRNPYQHEFIQAVQKVADAMPAFGVV